MASKNAFVAATLAAACLTAFAQLAPVDAADPVAPLVNQLELEKYKATVKGLTQFGDRRQGTKRNRDAVDWIEAQLKSYGCANVERLTYEYNPAPPAGRGGAGRGGRGNTPSPNGRGRPGNGPGGSRIFSDMRE